MSGPNGNRTRLAALAAAPLLALVASQGVALGAAPPANPVRITSSIRATGDDVSPTRTYGSPVLAVDPENPNNIVGATVEMRTRACRFIRSTDGGHTWKLMDAIPAPTSYPFCFNTFGTVSETSIAFGRNGTVYYAMSGWDNQDLGVADAHGGVYGNLSVIVARSDNLGESWETTTARNTRGMTPLGESNQAVIGMAVDRKSGKDDIVYVGYNSAVRGATPSPPSQAMVVTSTDGGKTFGEPVRAIGDFADSKGADKDKYGGGPPVLALDDHGTLYSTFFGNTTVPNTPANSILLAKSTDHGKTFHTTEVDKPDPYFGPSAVLMAWSAHGGRQGTLHIVYEDLLGKSVTTGDRDIYTQRSTDGGATWSDRLKISDDNPNKLPDADKAQTNPTVQVAPNGRVDAVWWDFRDDIGLFTNDAYYSYSTDNGLTWSKNIRVNDRPIDRRLGVWSNGYDMRQPVGVVSTDKLAVFAWDDTRNSDPLTQGQDIFSGIVQHQVVGTGGANGARYALAGLIGLATVGLILLAASMFSGRRRPAAGPAAMPSGQQPAGRSVGSP